MSVEVLTELTSLHSKNSIELCSAGEFFNPRTDECEPCSRGYFQPEPGRNTCLKCAHEWTTSSVGSTNESDCFRELSVIREGSKAKNKASSSDRNFLNSNASAVCPSGFFFDHASKICEPCSLRGYQPESGSDRCIPCPPTTVPLYLNSTAIEHCLEKCSPGWQRSPDGGRCESCPIGSFKSADDAVCMLCPTGWTTLNRGSRHIDDCRMRTCYPGTFLNTTSGSCAPCDYGLYMDEYDGRICKVCPVSTTTYQTGGHIFTRENCILRRMLGSNSITHCLSTNQCKS
ncbi:GCC2 and GCC3, partial [Oesophagostomum dentatum]